MRQALSTHLALRYFVFIKDRDCEDNIERLFYACDYALCCICCGRDIPEDADDDEATNAYPQCDEYADRQPVMKRRLETVCQRALKQ